MIKKLTIDLIYEQIVASIVCEPVLYYLKWFLFKIIQEWFAQKCGLWMKIIVLYIIQYKQFIMNSAGMFLIYFFILYGM